MGDSEATMETAERNRFKAKFTRHPFLVVAFVVGFILIPAVLIISGPLIVSHT